MAHIGAVTLIQRFGSALNLNIHFHMLFLGGVYVDGANGSTRFRWVRAPSGAELTKLAHRIAHRVGRFLERQGLLERDAENGYLATDAVNEDPMNTLLGHSITYRIRVCTLVHETAGITWRIGLLGHCLFQVFQVIVVHFLPR